MFSNLFGGVSERGGGSWSATNSTGTYSGTWGSESGNLSSYMGAISAMSNIASGISKYKQYSDNAELLAANSKAVWEEYKINKLAMDRNAVKQFGALQARTGEGGSAMDLLQESAMNYAVDAWRLKFNAQQKYNMLKKQEKAAKKASRGALGGSIGTAVGMVAGAVIGVMTGGVGFAAMAAAGAMGAGVGGAVGGMGGSMIGQM